MSDQGRFCWYELNTSDADAAQDFYEALFGWTVVDSGMPGIDYRLILLGEAQIGGMMGPFAGAPPPSWRGYVAVDDTDATYATATAAGATTYVPPHDIPEVGRFSVFGDPQGADIAILQPLPAYDRRPDLLETIGAVGWNELSTPDIDASWAFYQPLFDWKKGDLHDMGPMGHYQLYGPRQLDRDVGGIAGPMEQAGWLYYFNAEALDASVERVTAEGGTVAMVHQVPDGKWIAICADPQGARFALVAPER